MIDETFQQAFAHHRAGRLPEADALYRQVLALAPDHFDALHFHGVLLHQGGRHQEALGLIERALALDPEQSAANANLGLVLHALSRHAEAIASYDRALAVGPDSAGTWTNRGHAVRALRRYDEAVASFERAIALDPAYFEALSTRGLVLFEMRLLDAAVACLDQALALRPGDVASLSNRGGALAELQRPAEALASLNLALTHDPACTIALFNRGMALRDLKRPDEAAASFSRLLEIDPAFPWARGYLLNSKLQCCDWAGYDEALARLEAAVRSGSRADAPYLFLMASQSPAAQLECAKTWVADACPAAAEPVWRGARYRHDRIRIAYLSADLYEHAMAYLTAELFELHDRSRFEVTGVSLGPDDRSALRKRIERGFDRFIDGRALSDREVAQKLADLEIDIAVDMNGFTQRNRAAIFAQRCAPVQVAFLGYPGTMGAEYMDYIIADRHVIPSGDEKYYSEKVVRLPDTYQVNDRTHPVATRTPLRSEAGLPEKGFVFCCFNNNFKVTPQMFAIWMRLLAKIEGSVLWLLQDNALVVRNLRAEAEARGVAGERIVFAGRVSSPDHLARQRLADLFLDTLPYNAHTTASDALRVGLPLVTCVGPAFPGKVAGGLLTACGMPELVTHSLADYEALALRLAMEPGLLKGLRSKLEANRATCALFDTDRYRRHIEAAYTRMHARTQQGLPPEQFDVESPAGPSHRRPPRGDIRC